MKNYFSLITRAPVRVALSAALGVFLSGNLMAQTIDEVIVTSQKKATGISVQDVGVAITALDSNKISDSFSGRLEGPCKIRTEC